MWGFLITFLTIYAGFHVYLLWKLHAALPALRWPHLALVALFCVAMVAGPVASRMLDRPGHHELARVYGTACFVWMGLIWWFFSTAVCLDAWNLLVRGVALLRPSARDVMISPLRVLIVASLLSVIAAAAALLEAQNIRLTTVELATSRLAPGSAPIRLAMVSDLHLGIHTGQRRLARAAELIREAQPDVIISDGDLIDSPPEATREVGAMLAEVSAPMGKFAITGNHEYYVGLDKSVKFAEAAGFRMLRGESVSLAGGRLLLAGVDDPAGLWRNQPCRLDESAVLPAERNRPFTVLLKHQPRVEGTSVGRFDLQLSGHTHGGQIFPWHIFSRMSYRYLSGPFDLGDNSLLYVSRGTGTWGPPMRLFAPPEVTLVVIRPAQM